MDNKPETNTVAITLNVDPSILGKSGEDIINALSPEQKATLAKQLIEKWFMEPHDGERKLFIEQVWRELPVKKGSYANDENEYNRNQRIREFVSTREKMINLITVAAIESFRKRAIELVETDPQLEEKWQIIKGIIVERFPEMVQTAIISWFVRGMSTIGDSLGSLFGTTFTHRNLLNEMRERLNMPKLDQGGYDAIMQMSRKFGD